MNWDLLIKVMAAAAPFLVAIATFLARPDRTRAKMRHDAEILAMVPADLPAHKALGELVEKSVKQLLAPERVTRDIPMLALAVGGAGGLGWLAVWSFQRGTWWGILLGLVAGFFWLVFFFGIFESAQAKDRAAEKVEKDRKRAEKDRERAERAKQRDDRSEARRQGRTSR